MFGISLFTVFITFHRSKFKSFVGKYKFYISYIFHTKLFFGRAIAKKEVGNEFIINISYSEKDFQILL